jgi:putative tricarboxylic transport membrane protein
MTDNRIAQIIPYAVVGAAAGYLYYVAANFEFHARAGTLVPDVWPKAILALIIITCLYKIAAGLIARAQHIDIGGVLEDFVGEGDQGAAAPLESHPFLLLAGMALTVLYVMFIQKLGFFVATVPYIALFVILGGYRRWGVIAMMSVIGTIVLLFFFMKVVYVSLPIGEAPFSAVTLFLMQIMGIR